MSSPAKRVAVVRLDALGDTLLSTPAIDFLQREVGPENVMLLVSPGLSCLFGNAVACHEVPPGQSEQAMADLLDEFAADIVFVFSEKKRALRAAYLSKASQKIGFDPGWSQPIRSLEVKRFLTLRFPIVNSLESHSRYHEAERYCRLVGKGLSQKYVNGGPLRLSALSTEESHSSQTGPVGFQWTRKWLQEGWPERALVELVDSLPEETRLFVSPEELEWARNLIPESRRPSIVALPDLLDYARKIAECRYLVSIDTGAVHIASAMGTPVVDVFPESGAQHTVPRWRPWMVPHKIVLKRAYKPGEEGTLVSGIAEARSGLESVLRWKEECLPTSAANRES